MLRPVAKTLAGAVDDAAPGESDPPAPLTDALSILVVEDDARVLAATVDAVSELGHSAVACGNPLEAEALVEGRLAEGRGGFDLILSDVLRSEEHTSERQSLMRTSYAVVCLTKQNT